MADRVQNGTLVANESITVVIERHAGKLTVINRSVGGTIWVRKDGGDPTPEGVDCFPVLPLAEKEFDVDVSADQPGQIKIVAAEAVDYSVAGTEN